MEGLSNDQIALVEQFKSIADVEDDKIEDVVRLLTVNDFDLNSAISNYFDSGFISGENPVSSGVEVHDTDDSDGNHLTHRRGSHASQEAVNLQSQMFLDSLLPRLPAAPRISNHWQLDLGIHSSIMEEKSGLDTAEDSLVSREKVTSPLNAFWIFLLTIPKSLFSLILTLLRFIFRGSKGISLSHVRRYPRSFDYNNYWPGFKFLNHLARQFNVPAEEAASTADSDDRTIYPGSVSEYGEKEKREPSLLDNFNIEDENYNELHSNARNGNLWFLVVLVDDDEQSQDFLKQLLMDDKFDKLFNKSRGDYKENAIYVQNVNRSPEAFHVGKTYKARRLPYLMLIANVSNSPSVMASMSIVYRSNITHNFITQENIRSTVKNTLKNISSALESFTPQLITQRIDQQEMEFARMIKQQQDDAFSLSLEKDRIKKLQKEKEHERKQKLEDLAKTRELFLFHLVQSKWTDSLNEPVPKTKIAIKLPHGKRVIDVFSKSIKLNDLYLFVELKLFISSLITDSQNDISNEDEALLHIQSLELSQPDLTFDEYFKTFPFSFELIQPFPLKVIHAGNSSISECPELTHGANLLVEFRDDEGSEEDEVAEAST